MLPSELLETTWVNRAPNGFGENCLGTAFENCHLWRRAAPILRELTGASLVIDWNDAPGRTQKEVIALARLAEIKLGLRPVETEGTYDPNYVPQATVPWVVSEVRGEAAIAVLQ